MDYHIMPLPQYSFLSAVNNMIYLQADNTMTGEKIISDYGM